MKLGTILVVLFLVMGFATVPVAQAQYFKFDTDNYANAGEVEEALDAALKLFGTLTGGGLYHTAELHSVGGLDLGIRGILVKVPDDFQSLPIFADEDYVGIAFLHGSIGLPGNFELIGRFFTFPLGADADGSFTPPRVDSRGGVTLIGGGLKYGLIQMPGLPKVALIGTYHALLVPEEFDFGTVGTFSLKAVVSHSIPFFNFYIGGGIDRTKLTLDDDAPFLPGESFNSTSPHATVGLKFSLLPLLYANASYNIGEFNSFELGIGVTFR